MPHHSSDDRLAASEGLVPSGDQPAIAFIDLDGTLLGASSEKLFLKHLASRRLLGAGRLLRFAMGYILHPGRTLSQGKGWNRSYLKGLDAAMVRTAAGEFGKGRLSALVRPEIAGAVRAFSDSGWKTVLLTASLGWLASSIAGDLPFHMVIASVPEESGGLLTGGLVSRRPWGEGKVELAVNAAEAESTDLRHCAALGDSWSDRHLMLSCGYPVAVHPSPKLRRLAERRNWRLVEGVR